MRLTPEGSKTYNTWVALFYLHKIQNQSKPNFHIWVMKQLRKVKKCISLKYSKQNNDSPPQAVHVLISRTCECVSLHGKGDSVDMMKGVQISLFIKTPVTLDQKPLIPSF